jgi:hypothetical protein
MHKLKLIISLVAVLILPAIAGGQEKDSKKKQKSLSNPVMWERVNVRQQNLFLGPGGDKMRPNLKNITLIKRETGGSSKKYRIKDGSGRVWVAKIDAESQAETVAVRLLSALGYRTEINYLAPTLTIPGAGTFKNVRLEARPANVERLERWKWDDNPFEGTRELQGLKIMMAFLNNWDLKNPGNNIILQKGSEHQYVVSDVGATFGKTGFNPSYAGPLRLIFWAFTRSKNNPSDYKGSKFIDEIEDDGEIDFTYAGRNRRLLNDITIEHGRWLANLLTQLSDKQIEDAFRAANYSSADVKTFSRAVKNRIKELDRLTREKEKNFRLGAR